MTTTPAPRDERELFLSRFNLQGRFKYDENTHQFIPVTDKPEHFAMLERITACYCGWLERDTLAESELAEVRQENADLIEARDSRVAERLAALDALAKERDELRAELERVKADAVRYQWLCRKFEVTKLPCVIERILDGDVYVADGKASVDAAIDAARGV